MNKLDEKLPDFRTAQNRYFKFCETVEKQIRQTAAEVYPELVDGDAEQLQEFKYLFVRDIQAMHERIEKMLRKYGQKRGSLQFTVNGSQLIPKPTEPHFRISEFPNSRIPEFSPALIYSRNSWPSAFHLSAAVMFF